MAARKRGRTAAWPVAEAKAHFDEVIDEAENSGAQTLVSHGDERAAIVPTDGWDVEPIQDLVTFFQSSGLGDYDLDITRSKDSGRDVDD